MKNILVVGASSGIGLRVTEQGLEAGLKVRAFARSANKINLSHENLECVVGDALNKDDIAEALTNCDAVIQTLGVPVDLKLITGPIDLFSKATEILITQMQAKGVKRIITVTGYGAGESYDSINPLQKLGFNVVFKHAYSDKDKQESMIIHSTLDWTIVRPGVLTNAKRVTPYKILDSKRQWRNGIISRSNVADFILHEVQHNEYLAKAPVLIS